MRKREERAGGQGTITQKKKGDKMKDMGGAPKEIEVAFSFLNRGQVGAEIKVPAGKENDIFGSGYKT